MSKGSLKVEMDQPRLCNLGASAMNELHFKEEEEEGGEIRRRCLDEKEDLGWKDDLKGGGPEAESMDDALRLFKTKIGEARERSANAIDKLRIAISSIRCRQISADLFACMEMARIIRWIEETRYIRLKPNST